MRPALRNAAAVIGLTMAFAWAAAAETTEEPTERFKEAEVTGTVVAYTSRSLSLEFERSKGASQELLMPVDPAVTVFERLAGITDLKRGDRVRVAYRQFWRQGPDGAWTLKGAVATRIARLGESLESPRLKSGTDGGGL